MPGWYICLPIKVISFETGIPVDEVIAILEKFERDGKIHHEGSLIWVTKLLEHNAQNFTNLRIQKNIRDSLADIANCDLKRAWIAYYNSNIAYVYGMDKLSMPNLQEQEQEHKQEHNSDKSDVNKSPAKSLSPSREMFSALMVACNIAEVTDKFRGWANRNISRLLKSGVSPSDILAFHAFWVSNDWRKQNTPMSWTAFTSKFDVWVSQGKPSADNGKAPPENTDDDLSGWGPAPLPPDGSLWSGPND